MDLTFKCLEIAQTLYLRLPYNPHYKQGLSTLSALTDWSLFQEQSVFSLIQELNLYRLYKIAHGALRDV